MGLRSVGAVSKAVQSSQVPEGLVRAGFPLGRPRVVSYKGGFVVRLSLRLSQMLCIQKK